MAEGVETDAKVTNQMRLSNPLLLLSLGVVLAAASCTLITDVDRSKIPDEQAGGSAGGDAPTGGTMSVPQAGEAGVGGGGSNAGGSGGTGTTPGGAGAGGSPEAGAGGTAEGGSAGAGGTPEGGAGAAGATTGGAGAGN